MKVRCQIINGPSGYEGVITNESGATVYHVIEPCAEDANGMMELAIINNGWEVLPYERLDRPCS